MKINEIHALYERLVNEFVSKINIREFDDDSIEALGDCDYVATIEDVDIRDHENGIELCIEREYKGKEFFAYSIAKGIVSEDTFAYDDYEPLTPIEVVYSKY